MKKHFSIYRFALAIVMAAGAGLIVMAVFGSVLAFLIGFGISLFISCLPGKTKGMAFEGLATEVWQESVERNLWRSNKFLAASVDDSKYVNNLSVHIPNAGNPPEVTINGVLPAGAVDTESLDFQDRKYDIDVFRTPPFRVKNADKAIHSYDEMDAVLFESMSAINQKLAEQILIKWAPTGTSLLVDGITTNANIIRTSGIVNNNPDAARKTVLAHLKGASNERLAFGVYDVILAASILDDADIPEEDRYMLLDSQMHRQLLSDLSKTEMSDFSRAMDPKTGVIGSLFGFSFFKRSRVLAYNNAANPVVKALGAAGAADDNAAALFWWKGAVSKASGDVKVFPKSDDPTYYGDIVSLEVRAGGANRRPTELGIGAIVQAAPVVGA